MLDAIRGYAGDAYSFASKNVLAGWDALANNLPLVGTGSAVVASTIVVANYSFAYYKATQQVKLATKAEDIASAQEAQKKAYANLKNIALPAAVAGVAVVATYQFGNDVVGYFKPAQPV